MTNSYFPNFLARMIWIRVGYSERIEKYCCCFLKGDAVLSQIRLGLLRIPLINHGN